MGISSDLPSKMAVVGMNVSKKAAVNDALVVSAALDAAKQIADTPPAAPAAAGKSSRPGGVDVVA